MRPKHHWIFLYDIKDPKRLSRVAKLAESFGNRIQKSVFEFYADYLLIDSIEKRIKMLITEEDSIAFVPICQTDWEKTVRLGIINISYSDPIDEEGTLFI
jgi:CRISPR-associated protein Cas2